MSFAFNSAIFGAEDTSDLPVSERLDRLEAKQAGKVKLDDLPLADLQRKLELGWNPDGSSLLETGSVGADALAPIEDLRAVGAAGQPAFAGAWGNFGATDGAAFYKERGRVYLSGIVSAGAVPGTIFTLPTGYWPRTGRLPRFAVLSNSLLGFVFVDSATGNVTVQAGSNVWVDLSPISFLHA